MKIILSGDLNMRLYNIYYICKKALNDIKDVRVKKISDNGTMQINTWETYQQALQSLVVFDFIKKDVIEAYNVLDPVNRERQFPSISLNIYQKFNQKNNILVEKLKTVIDLYESMKDNVSQPGIDIKIPKCNSLKEYIGLLKDIDFIFSYCTYLKSDTEEIKYNGTDVGSDWITFTIIVSSAVSAGFVILNNLASIMNKAVALQSNKKVLDMQEETYKTMQLKNEVTQDTIDAFKRMKELTYKKYVDELQDELGELENGDEEGRVAKSLEKLANLIDKGIEIHTSIETPKEIKVLFPFAENQQELPNNLLKYLEDKTTQNDNQ